MIVSELIEKISNIAKIKSDELNEDTALYDSNVISSLTLLELIVHTEKKYSILISPDELFDDNFKDIGSLAKFIHKKQKTS